MEHRGCPAILNLGMERGPVVPVSGGLTEMMVANAARFGTEKALDRCAV
jgi:hypothetical protein